MNKMSEHFDFGTLFVIAITFVVFVIALFVKGFTHDLLLEIGVFLISVKLVLMGYKNSVTTKELLKELCEIRKSLGKDKNNPT
ncbi:MAG: hypothetical protein P8130_10610 [Deltaproteobacteria bacterium]